MNIDALDASILLPAFLAGALIISTHVPFGLRVLERGIIFIDLAIAQVAGLGVIIADTIGWELAGWGTQVAATGAAILAALGLNFLEARYMKIQEALIGVLFVLAATASILFLADNPHGGEHLKDLLVGQILFVSFQQLWPIGLLYAAVLTIWWTFAIKRGSIWFYILFAIVVTASVQLVGIYLVFASLIIPALAIRHASKNSQLIAGYLLGLFGYASGLCVSALFDLPSGAVVVWMLAVTGLLVSFIVAFQNNIKPDES